MRLPFVHLTMLPLGTAWFWFGHGERAVTINWKKKKSPAPRLPGLLWDVIGEEFWSQAQLKLCLFYYKSNKASETNG